MPFPPANDVPSQAGPAGVGRNYAPVPVTTVNGLPCATRSQEHGNTDRPYRLQDQSSSNSESQATLVSPSDSNRIFTSPMAHKVISDWGAASHQGSSQESQSTQFSRLVAAQDKVPDHPARSSSKRAADGAVKEATSDLTLSPHRLTGHSRNTSAVSAASTTSSCVTELSSELKTRLSYALLKVNNGWERHNIDEVENFRSGGGSPASTNSTTIPGATRSSASSPQVQVCLQTTPVPTHHTPQEQEPGTTWQEVPSSPQSRQAPARLPTIPPLAPPVPIQPHLAAEGIPRPHSKAQYSPRFLSPRPHHAGSPYTPPLASLSLSPGAGTPGLHAAGDAAMTPPMHNIREKDAMEALLFMSSPGNSVNLNRPTSTPSSQTIGRVRNVALAATGPPRTALPTSAPKRKILPNGRPLQSAQPPPTSHSPKIGAAGVGKSASATTDTHIDEASGPRRPTGYARPVAPAGRLKDAAIERSPLRGAKFAVPLATAPGRPMRPKLRIRPGEDLDAVLDRMAAEASSSDDSEDEIKIPGSSGRH